MVTMAGDLVSVQDEGFWVSDVLRFCIIVASLWLAALALRLGYLKHRTHRAHLPTDPPCRVPHPLVYVSYAAALVLISGLRITHLGEPITPDLWWSFAVLVPGFIGVLSDLRLRWWYNTRRKESR